MSNQESEINNAIFAGLIGLAATFFTIERMLIEENIEYLSFLIVLFLVVSLVRTFGTILKIKVVNSGAVEFFRYFVVPASIFVLTRILITQIFQMESKLNTIPSFLSGLVFGATVSYEIISRYEFDFRLHFKVRRRKKSSPIQNKI